MSSKMDTSNSVLSKWSVDLTKSAAGKSSLTQSPLLSSLQQKSTLSSNGPLGKHKSTSRETTTGKKTKTEKTDTRTTSLLQSTAVGSHSILSGSSLKSSLIIGSSLKTGTSSLLSASGLTSQLDKSVLGSSRLSNQSKLISETLPQQHQSKTLIGRSPLTQSLSTGFSLSHGSVLTGLASSGHHTTDRPSLLGSTGLKSKPSTSHISPGGSKPLKESPSHASKKSSKPRKSKGRVDDNSDEKMQLLAMKRYQILIPEYDLSREVPMDFEETEGKEFLDIAKDPFLNKIQRPLHDINGMKHAFINAVSGSLICQPNFRNSTDLTRRTLSTMADRLVPFDPEFILKVAMYTRKELNIRTTANFLLALAANVHPCRPFLKKYYCMSIALPSDWIEVAEIYQAFHDKTLNQGSIPAALRKVMITKFPSFDKYQLAKYNKESSSKKKKKKKAQDDEGKFNQEASVRGRGRGRGQAFRGQVRGRGQAFRGQVRGRGQAFRGQVRGRGQAFRGQVRGRGQAFRGQVRGHGGAPITTRKPPQKKKSLYDSDSSDSSDSDSDEEGLMRQISDVVYDEKETEEELSKMKFSLKQLIRKLHIAEPVEHVMCLVGKRYPKTMEDFYQSRLPGTWDEERAGKRMKLPIPETWETQVSLKGNKASTWEALIDHNKLPFMAMLRNLRNLIKAGISDKHHNSILHRLTNERQVINSKQFPFRFFSAYEVLGTLEQDYEKTQSLLIHEAENNASMADFGAPQASRGGGGRGRGRGCGGKKANPEMWWLDKKNKKQSTKETLYDTRLIARYRKALDKSVKIATTYNVQPIRGRTIVLCDIGPSMEVNCTAAKGLGKPRQMKEVAVLMGLMCKYSCEECDLVAFTPNTYFPVELKPGTILENMDKVLDPDTLANAADRNRETMPFMLPHSILVNALRDRTQIDNLIFLSGGDDVPTQQAFLSNFLKKYREIVNSDLLYVNISFAGRNCGFSESIKPEHDNDIYISGYSDQILRFIAERGEGGQLRHVEKIDEAYSLKPMPTLSAERGSKPTVLQPQKPLPVPSNIRSWRTLRVFISSTFRDMHGERDMLTRFVFPELRALAKKHFLNVYEVDLRWGVTEKETRTNRTLELCLTEVKQCHLFVGILGERYGWTPDVYIVPESQDFDWVRECEPGLSVTELEMYSGAIARSDEAKESAFFYFRDNTFEKDVPSEFKSDFMVENSQTKAKMDSLKTKIRKSGLEVYDGYPCQWGGIAEDKPIVSGLELFGARVLNNLWNAVQKLYIQEANVLDENTHTLKQHQAMLEHHQENFVGRKSLIKDCLKQLQNVPSGILGLVGKPGTGKSAVMAAFVQDYIESPMCDGAHTVLTHVVGAAPASTNILATMRRLSHEIKRQFGLIKDIPEDFKNLTQVFGEMTEEAGSMCGSPLIVFIDGIDSMENAYLPANLEWMPSPVPKNVIFVLTALEGGQCYKSIQRNKGQEVSVGGLDMWDKADVVRTTLAIHRKTLDETPFNNQLKLLLSKKEASVPLFLKLACEELRVFGVFEEVSSKLKSLPHTIPQLLQEVLARLENDLGKDVVILALSLLICAREGLDSEELHELLSLKALLGNTKISVESVVNVQLTQDKLITPVVFSQIKRSLQSFLNPQNDMSRTRLNLAHADIEAAVRKRYLQGSAAEQEVSLHKLLAGYFYQLADPERNQSFHGKNTRAYSELPYHLSCAGEFKKLQEVLCDLRFISKKFELGLTHTLLDDFQPRAFGNKSMERDQNKMVMSSIFQQYKMFVSRNSHVLSSYPALTWQQAINEPSDSVPAQQAASLTEERRNKLYMEWANKPAVKDPCYLTLDNLPQPVMCVTISPDNKYFACGGLDCLVHLYDLATGKEVRTFRGHSDVVSGVCFIGRSYLCSASHDTTLSIWHVEDGHRVHLLKGHTRKVKSCAADPSGKLLASASWDCTVKVWDTSKGTVSCHLNVGSPVNSVSFHPEGQLIVTGSWDATLKIWDVFHKTRKAVLRGHSSSVRDVAYSPSGRHIASASLDGDVKIWAAQNGTQVGSIQGHADPINKLIYSPTGKELITVSDDHKVKVWSGQLGLPMWRIGEEGGEPIVAVTFDPSCTTVALGYHSGMVRVYDTLTGSELWGSHHHTARVRALSYSPDGQYLVTGADDNNSKVIVGSDGIVAATAVAPNFKPILCVSTAKNYIATGGEDFQCHIYPAVKANPGKRPTVLKSLANLTGHVGPITSCEFSPNERQIVTASRDATIRIWELRLNIMDSDASPIQVLNACHADWITGCKWSTAGDFLVTASNDFTLKVWDVKNGTEKQKMTGHMSSISSVAYKYGCIVSSCNDGSVKVWSHKGTEITTLHGHQRAVHACDLYVRVSEEDRADTTDPDEMDWSAAVEAEEAETKAKKTYKPAVKLEEVIVVTCSDDGTAMLWKPLQANELANLTGHSDKVVSVAANKDGHLCTSSLDKGVRLWEPQLSTETATNVHNAPVTFMESSPSKAILLTGSRDGMLKLWNKSSEDSLPVCALSVQAHKKSVNTACFLPTSTAFVTGGDDGQIIVWTIRKKNNSIHSLQKTRVYTNATPISTLACCGEMLSSSGQIFLSGDWSGKLTVWNTVMANEINSSFQFGKDDWISKIRFVPGMSTPTFYVSTSNGHVSKGTVNKNGQKIEYITSFYIKPSSDVPAHKQVPVRILDLSNGYAVDSKGQISCFYKNLNHHNETKIHSAPVTSVVCSSNFVFTGSQDCTVKVWSKDSQLTQMGLFFCPAPVQSLVVISQCESQGKRTMLRLACGDQLGNIHFLTWRQ